MRHAYSAIFDNGNLPLWDAPLPAPAKPVVSRAERDGVRERILFVLLCGVLFTSMFNGLVKQAFNWSQVAYVALDLPWVAFLGVWALWPRPASRTKSGGVGLLLVVILCYGVLQTFNPLLDSPFMAIGAARNRLLPIFFFWVGKDLLTARRANRLLILCFVIAAFAALFGLLQWKVGLKGVSNWGPGFVPRTSLAWRTAEGEPVLRPLSIYQDGGIAALFGGAVLFCMTMVYGHGRKADLTTWAIRFASMLCIAFVAVSGVRAAVLCAAFGLCAASMLNVRRIVPLTLVLSASLAILFAIGAAQKLAERYVSILNPVDAYVANRGDIAMGFIDVLQLSPMGIGTGAASPAAEFYAKAFGGVDEPKSYRSDNGYGNLLAEGGVPLVALYVTLLLTIMWQAWKRRNATGPARSVAHGVFVFTAILGMWSATALPIDWQPTNLVFWLLVGSMFSVPAAPAGSKPTRAEPALAAGAAR